MGCAGRYPEERRTASGKIRGRCTTSYLHAAPRRVRLEAGPRVRTAEPVGDPLHERLVDAADQCRVPLREGVEGAVGELDDVVGPLLDTLPLGNSADRAVAMPDGTVYVADSEWRGALWLVELTSP